MFYSTIKKYPMDFIFLLKVLSNLAFVMSTRVEQDQESFSSNSRTGLKRKQKVTPEGAGICSGYTYKGMNDINASDYSDTYVPSNDAIAKVISVIVTNEFSEDVGEKMFEYVLGLTANSFENDIEVLNSYRFDSEIDDVIKYKLGNLFENIKKAILSTSDKEFRDAETNDAGINLMESTHSEPNIPQLKGQTLGERISNFNTKENAEKIQETAEKLCKEMLVQKFTSLYVNVIMKYIKLKLCDNIENNVAYIATALSLTTSDITFDCLHDRLSKFSVTTEQQPLPMDEDACGLQATTDDTAGIKFACTQKESDSSEQSMSEEERVIESLD